jgi:micrococcal nuclease
VQRRFHISAALLSVGLTASACGVPADANSDEGAGESTASSTTEVEPAVDASSSGQPTAMERNGTVIFVIDGDTVKVDFDGTQESIRFIGIDTPEKTGGFRDAECFGDEASARMHELLSPGDGVYIELDAEPRDRFDRLLGYVYRASDGAFLNKMMVEEGLAAAFPFPPNTLYADDFDTAEATARRLDLGLWRACGGPDVVLESRAD